MWPQSDSSWQTITKYPQSSGLCSCTPLATKDCAAGRGLGKPTTRQASRQMLGGGEEVNGRA